MSEPIFERYVDEHGNISVRVSRDVQVLTREEANRIEAEYRRMQADNAKLRELVLCLLTCSSDVGDACDKCPVNGGTGIWDFEDFCDSLLDRVHELRIEVG